MPLDVKAIRQTAGLTQQQLADQLGVKVLAVKRWEAGLRAPNEVYEAKLRTVAATPPSPVSPAPSPPAERAVLRLAQAVRLMGLKDEGHGRRSDRTLRNALKSKQLFGWRAPGYRESIAEWCFYADDFEHWRTTHYQAHRDPRRNQPPSPATSRSTAPRLVKRQSR